VLLNAQQENSTTARLRNVKIALIRVLAALELPQHVQCAVTRIISIYIMANADLIVLQVL
jgi:hypothetical protein